MPNKVLLTGANGYIGSNLLPLLIDCGHHIVVLVRNKSSFHVDPNIVDRITLIEGDLELRETLDSIPHDIDVAYYLVHAMATSISQFDALEKLQAENFIDAIKQTKLKQIIYLGGLISSDQLSRHLSSRLQVETILKASGIPFTILRAGIIIGSGSASFEIIRDLVEKLPIMVAPKWVQSRCQPISIDDMLTLLIKVVNHEQCLNQVFDVGGPEQLTYKNILQGYAACRGLKRWIITVPVLTPRLSSYWLIFVTSTNFYLAMTLVDSLKNDAICNDLKIFKLIPIPCLTYQQAVKKCFEVTDVAPKYGCLIDEKNVPFHGKKIDIIERLWAIGGEKGWYAMNWAWKLRGWIDSLVGGVGLRRGRNHPHTIKAGDHLDFWRVIVADKVVGQLLLKAEMKVPGEAWLEFHVSDDHLMQKATFRPRGVFGYFYWYLLLPIHKLVFNRMAKNIAKLSS